MSLQLCLVSANDDLIIIGNKQCIKCTQEKLNLKVLRIWDIDKKKAKTFLDINIKGYNVKCLGHKNTDELKDGFDLNDS